MTQVKLWQIISQTTNGMVWSDPDGNLVTIPAGSPEQVLVINAQGAPEWVANTALSTALQAQTDATNAIATANAYTQAQIAALVDNAPVALNTLNELAVKLATDESALNALILQVDNKADSNAVTTQVAQGKQEAVTDSKAYTDNSVSSALFTAASLSQEQATTAQAAAESAAALDASTKVNGLQLAIPDTYRVESTAIACFLADSNSLLRSEIIGAGAVIRSRFGEINGSGNTGAVDTYMTVKMLLINGVATPSDWSIAISNQGEPMLQMSPTLAAHVFDGTLNTVMLIAEYKCFASIKLIPAPVV